MDKSLISHVGIAVADLETGIARYELLIGRKPLLVREVAEQRVKVAIFAAGGSTGKEFGGRIELVAATDPLSPVNRFIEKRGEGLHHICIHVDDIVEKLSELKKAGVQLIDETPRIGAEGRKVAFVHPQGMNGVLIELEEGSG